MGYIQVQFYQNDFNNNYCGGGARADKVKQMLSRTSKGWQWQKGLDKGWQELAWSSMVLHGPTRHYGSLESYFQVMSLNIMEGF